MKKELLLMFAFAAGIALAQTPNISYNFNNTLVGQNGGYTFVAKTGSAKWTTATKPGNGSHALSLDGSTLLTSSFKMDTVKSFTLSFWVNYAKYESQTVFSQMTVIHPVPQDPSVTNNRGIFRFLINYNSTEGAMYPSIWVTPDGQVEGVTSYKPADSLTKGWHHIAMTWENNSVNDILTMFIDGRKIFNYDPTYLPKKLDKNYLTEPLTIGGQQHTQLKSSGPPVDYTQSSYTGDLDELKIFESKLDSNQIKTLYNNGTLNHENISKTNAIIYPNPTENILHILNSELISEIKILDMNGKEVLKENYQDLQGQRDIDVSMLAVGNYAIHMVGANFNEVKIIQKR